MSHPELAVTDDEVDLHLGCDHRVVRVLAPAEGQHRGGDLDAARGGDDALGVRPALHRARVLEARDAPADQARAEQDEHPGERRYVVEHPQG
jgi:hypothetical protein